MDTDVWLSLLAGIPSSSNAVVEIRLSANPGSMWTLGIGISLMYLVEYKGRLCFVSPSRRSSLLKAMVALTAFWTERHSVQGPPASFFSPFEELVFPKDLHKKNKKVGCSFCGNPSQSGYLSQLQKLLEVALRLEDLLQAQGADPPLLLKTLMQQHCRLQLLHCMEHFPGTSPK
ncbi:hypothetical protein MRB53_014067 [Persea americana]|uniref:Uncharacterized protein n=1 Tax=Persea americana TaxID=3435 RepID=A0ACC2K9X7_PERAE|nr:hypothetical protein MRB53_014067 [Persea americana]